jgi:5'-3' exonuclease
MIVHLIDGTYELFRYFFAVPPHRNAEGREVGAVRGVLGSMLQLLEEGATHVGIATDHVIESFRNDLYAGYKTGEGIDPALHEQFGLLEEVLEAVGFRVWPMVEYEADDGLGAAAAMAAADTRVDQVVICTPDKDLAQCVSGKRVVQLDRRQQITRDREGVIAKFGVPPESIPDYLGLVGDSADGFPGLKGWGAKSTAIVLARYGHIEAIPDDDGDWDLEVRGARKLAQALAEGRDDALLFRKIATIVCEIEGTGNVDDIEWKGPRDGFEDACRRIDASVAIQRINRLLQKRAG